MPAIADREIVKKTIAANTQAFRLLVSGTRHSSTHSQAQWVMLKTSRRKNLSGCGRIYTGTGYEIKLAIVSNQRFYRPTSSEK